MRHTSQRRHRAQGRAWISAAAIAAVSLPPVVGAVAADLPPEIAAGPGESVTVQVHAVGAQIYECKLVDGHLGWQFREPIASLFNNGKTVGRHYAGPRWEIDGSILQGKVVSQAPGATPKDIAWLKLTVTDSLGDPAGPLEEVTTIQRINTQGGQREGACDKAGDLVAEPYSADYVFLQKPD
jgi:hypothetical protein